MTAADRERLADLERRVAELSHSVQVIAVQATAVRTLEQMWFDSRDVKPPAIPPRRQRHLQAVPGGAS